MKNIVKLLFFVMVIGGCASIEHIHEPKLWNKVTEQCSKECFNNTGCMFNCTEGMYHIAICNFGK